MKTALLSLALLGFTGEARQGAHVKPTIVAQMLTPEGALIRVQNPLHVPIWVRFECPNAFTDWIAVGASKLQLIDVHAGEPIEKPCLMGWKFR
jgi:hypothetical protein